MIIAIQTLIFFRESLLAALERLIRPYYKNFTFVFNFNRRANELDEDENEEQVYAEYDDERGVVFFPPVYTQRYAAVSDCLMDERWCGKLEKVVDFGYHDVSFIKYLKEVPGIRRILGVDIETIPLRCSSDLLGYDDYIPVKENSLQITLYQGNAADPDYRLIGCDAVIAIEMIEHMLPHDLDRFVHTVFGFIKPMVAIITTPNGDFNVLFKALEKNGLRRLDHFFEWSRKQFHDWCSNIVIRYPNYTVSCKGIGPGPPGTVHLGCCSQLALFISKDYHKQQDLNPNSLSLVASAPNPNNLSDMMGSWDHLDTMDTNMGSPNNNDSFTDFLYSDQQCVPSCMTLVLTPSFSLESIEYRDETSQCNLDNEISRNFLMFDDDQLCYNVIIPRRKFFDNKVYEMEDVTCRLNCTTFQIKKFSKTTQNLMARNKIDTLVHTREVVDEIRQLTKMLNFNKDSLKSPDDSHHIWCNINWGDNAPYWNQYYKLVRDYKYPFEIKSEECRILELVSDEINRLVDTQVDDFSQETNRLEISLDHLMGVVSHISDDMDNLKDLLEWNGYEIIDDIVVHSRLAVENGSTLTHDDDWQDHDTFSDCDTIELHSTSMSDGSTVVPEYHGHHIERRLRHALDKKVKKLRSIMTADEDITTELDRVVCRLLKLSLKRSKGKPTPPPARWMQSKLLDLLTLTEKAIERRKRHYIETYLVKGITGTEDAKSDIVLNTIKDDNSGWKVVNKYRHLVEECPDNPYVEETVDDNYNGLDFYLEDDTSNDFPKVSVESDDLSEKITAPSTTVQTIVVSSVETLKEETTLERTQAWLEEDGKEVIFHECNNQSFNITSGDTDPSSTISKRSKNKKSHRKQKKSNIKDFNAFRKCLGSESKRIYDRYCRKLEAKRKNKEERSKTKITKKIPKKKSAIVVKNHYINKIMSMEYGKYPEKSKRRNKDHHNLQSTSSKPIPGSLIDLCHPELKSTKMDRFHFTMHPKTEQDPFLNSPEDKTATDESQLNNIIMVDAEETNVEKRTIGTDHDENVFDVLDECVVNIIKQENSCNNFEEDTEIIPSNTLFIHDIDEPSTSKGFRHTSMDVQCGSDICPPVATSLTQMPEDLSNVYTMGDSLINQLNNVDFGTSTNEDDGSKILMPRTRTIGIKIKDSNHDICDKKECSTMTQEIAHPVRHETSSVVTELIKPFSNALRSDYSGSEICSVCSRRKSPPVTQSPNDTSNYQLSLSASKYITLTDKLSSSKYIRPRLSCGGIHVHSYKDKEVSEDVVFQGEWQKNKPKPVPRKKGTYIPVLARKVSEMSKRMKVNSKEKLTTRRAIIKAVRKNSDGLQKTITKKQSDNNKDGQNRPLSNKISVRNIRNTLKVAPKLITNASSKQCSKLQDIETTKIDVKCDNEIDNTQHKMKKSAKPYLRKKNTLTLSKTLNEDIRPKNNLIIVNSINKVPSKTKEIEIDSKKRSFARSKTEEIKRNVNKIPPLVRSKTEEIKRHVSKIPLSERPKTQVTKRTVNKFPLSERSNTMENKINADKLKFTAKSKTEGGKRNVEKPHIPTRSKDDVIKKICDKLSLLASPKLEETKINGNKLHALARSKTEDIKRSCHKITVLKRSKTLNIKRDPNKLQLEQSPVADEIEKGLINTSYLFKSKIEELKANNKSLQRSKTEKIKIDVKNIPGFEKSKTEEIILNVNRGLEKVKSNEIKTIPSLVQSETNTMKINLGAKKFADTIVTSKPVDIKKDLLKFRNNKINMDYVVFRNELETKNSQERHTTLNNACDSTQKKEVHKRPNSPHSQNSSTCSSYSSISTVRAASTHSRPLSGRKRSTSNKSNLADSESEGTPSSRGKKYSKIIKSPKKTDVPEHDDKENRPGPSQKSNMERFIDKTVKSGYVGRTQKVYMTQVDTKNPCHQGITNSKSKTMSVNNKSHIKIPSVEIVEDKNIPTSHSDLERKSLPQDLISQDEIIEFKVTNYVDQKKSNLSNKHITNISQNQILPQKESLVVLNDKPEEVPQVAEQVNNIALSVPRDSNIDVVVKEVLDKTIGLIESLDKVKSCDKALSNTGTYICKDSKSRVNFDTISPTSYMTVVSNENNFVNVLKNDLFDALNRALKKDSVVSVTGISNRTTELDVCSFKSAVDSRQSEYYLARSRIGSSNVINIGSKSNSVKDIFERKDLNIVSTVNTGGLLAIQAFSGFSMNENSIFGDQPQYVNLVDSEPGSLAVEISRNANSEELMVSGRSSLSYESCIVDEDVVVPNWLFNIISQHHAVQDEIPIQPQAMALPMPALPLAIATEPVYDVNGNVEVAYAAGLGAGAGDGRGMHSDLSQDSSGQGTSLSSSDTSSGQHEEVSLDAAAFMAQYEQIATDSSDALPTIVVTAAVSPEVSSMTTEVSELEDDVPNNSRRMMRVPPNLRITSDVDADISSNDTDANDNSDS